MDWGIGTLGTVGVNGITKKFDEVVGKNPAEETAVVRFGSSIVYELMNAKF